MNSRIRTVIVDDEPLALNLISSFLQRYENIEIVASCNNGNQAIDAVRKHQPDLMFLDIQMPGMDGFDVIKRLQAELTPVVVFVTAYQQYAVEAFDINAVDYILKPLDEDLLKRAIERSQERLKIRELGEQSKSKLIDAIEHITHSTGQEPSDRSLNNEPVQKNQKIVVKDRNSITLIDQEDIDWIDAAGDYMCIHVDDTIHIMRSTLKKLLSQLNQDIFKRVHRSTIVNMNRIQKIIPHTKGECFLVIKENEKIKVSRNYRTVVKDMLSAIDADK